MSTLWFSSDHHFNHANVIKYCSRPYSDVNEMNEKLVEEWNKVVQAHDRVFYLGDFSLSPSALPFVSRLNGSKVLVPGNHDGCFPGHKGYQKRALRYIDAGFTEVHSEPLHRVYEKIEFLAWHLPYRPAPDDPVNKDMRYVEWRPKDEGKWLLHGHCHGKWRRRGRMIDVGVDAWGMRPVSWEEIKELMTDPRDFVGPKTHGGLAFSALNSIPQEIVL